MATSARNSPGPVRIPASRYPNQMARPQTVAYTAVNDILDGKIAVGQLVSICGVIKDLQLPTKSRGTDYKMTIRLADKDSEASCSTIALHLFANSEDDMLTAGAFDVVYIHKAKVQTFGGGYSLLSSDPSTITCYSSAVLKLPKPCTDGNTITTWTRLVGTQTMPVPDNDMTRGAVALFKHMVEASGDDLDAVVETFKIQVAKTANIRDKNAPLKNVRARNFYDLTVRVVTEPRYVHAELATMWVSDYTENDEFEKKGAVGLFADFDSAAAPGSGSGSRTSTTVGDEYGYLNKFTAGSGGRGGRGSDKKKMDSADANWTGPVGRYSMLVTCFDEHARAIKDEVRRGSWVKLANVHIAYGRYNTTLEGFLRTDANAFGHRLSVEVLDMQDLDPKTMDPRHLEAMKRQERYEKAKAKFVKEQKKRQQRQQRQQQQQQQAGKKREGDAAENSRQRRRRLRMPREGGAGGSEAGDDDDDRDEAQQQAAGEKTSRAIVCEAGRQPETSLAHVLQPALYASLGGDDGIVLPFANFKFKARVRVVDFMPNCLTDFAVARWVGELGLTGFHNDEDDDENLSSSSSSEDDASVGFGADPRGGRDSSRTLVWEWRFALLLEDAVAETPRSIWAVVNNADAQLLTGMNACNLRKNSSALDTLRQKMFLLWGNLEETKQEEARRAALQKRAQRDKEAAAARLAKEAKEAKEAKAAREAQKAQQQRDRQIAVQTGGNTKHYPPDASSDAEPEDEPQPRRSQLGQHSQPNQPSETPAGADPPGPVPPLINRPFVCCIRQFGIRARADKKDDDDDAMSDSSLDDEQPVKREWRQMFSMYGTSIRG